MKFMQRVLTEMFGVLALGFGLPVQAAQSAPAALPSPGGVFAPKGPILMARTPVAPFNAEGSAIFLASFGSTNGPAILSLDLRGFSPGRYLLGIVRASDETFVPLAKLLIIDPTAGPDRDATLNSKTVSNGQQAESLVSQHIVPLPTIADPIDIAKLVLADAYGNYLLIASFKPPREPPGAEPHG